MEVYTQNCLSGCNPEPPRGSGVAGRSVCQHRTSHLLYVVARGAGLEPATSRLVIGCSVPLSYPRVTFSLSLKQRYLVWINPRIRNLRGLSRRGDRGRCHYPLLLQREIMERGPYLHVVVERYLGPIFGSLARILRAGIRRGEFRSVDVNQTVVSLIAITVFYFAATPVMSLVLGGNAYDARRVAARKRAVVDFVRHGLLRSPHQKPSAATNRKRAKKKWRKR